MRPHDRGGGGGERASHHYRPEEQESSRGRSRDHLMDFNNGRNQYHDQRTEDWIITRGSAKIVLDDEEVWRTEGERIRIKVGQKHRVSNPSFDNKLEFIEVQTGTYFGEDDIVRIDDDYGRGDYEHLKDHIDIKEDQLKNKTDWWKRMSNEK